MKIPRALIYLLAAIPTPTLAQSHLPQGIAEELEDWRAHYGPEWEIVYDETTSMARMLFGGKLPAPYVPQTEAEEFALGRFFLDKAYGLFGLDDDTLEDDRTIFLPLGMVAGTDKLAVRFRQVVDGVPLHEGWVNVLLDAGDGSLLSIDSMGQPNLRNFDVDPATDAPTAEALAEQEFEMQTGATADPIDPAALQVYEVGVGGLSTPELVWRVDVRGTDVAGVEHAFAYFVAAEGTPAIVAAVDRVSYFAPQVPGQGQTGKVRAKITANGTCSDLSCGHPCCFIPDGSAVPGRITVNLPHLTVENAAGQTTTTDANGEFVLAPPLPYTFRLEGPFVSVETRLSSQTLVAEASQLGTVVMNPTATEVNVAQTNAFQKINKMRDWVRHVNPLDATMDSSSAVASVPYLARVNEIDIPCSSFHIGDAVVFSRSLMGCSINMAYSTVIWHEMGHWLNDRYGNGNQDNGTGFAEGASDVYALYQADFPIFANGHPLPQVPRNAETATEMWCGDCESDISHPSCNGGLTHKRGKVLMASFWRLRQNLKAAHDDATGREISDALFLGWMNAFDQNRIHSIILWQLMVLDDRDGDWTNGSPNLASIENAFTEQGFPALANPSLGEHVTTVICP